jgi:AAA15 family ATPase/GTPase
MIQEIKIQNFLSFKDEVTFSFEATTDSTLSDYYIIDSIPGVKLLKLAMVYGANASGKSNLINAVHFLRNLIFNDVDNKEEEINFHAFEFDSTRDDPGKFEMIFYVANMKHKYQVIVDKKFIYEEKLFAYTSVQPSLVFNRYYNDNLKTSVIEFGSKIKISNAAKEQISLLTLKNISVFAAFAKINLTIPEINNVFEWFNNQFLPPIFPSLDLTGYSDVLIKENAEIKKSALEFIRKADFNISDIHFITESKSVGDDFLKMLDYAPISKEEKERISNEKSVSIENTFYEHKIEKNGNTEFHRLSEEFESRGTLRYYGLSGPFHKAIENNAFLIIDEIGTSLHPLLVIHFIKEFLKKSKTSQLLCTTHNMSLLMEKDILRRDAIWITEKAKNGATSLYSIADFPEFRKELSFFNYYKQGKFGGIPELD